MVTIKNNYVLSEEDKKIIFSVDTDNSERQPYEDAVIKINKDIDPYKCIEMLEIICNTIGAVTIGFRDIYELFHDSGTWNYEEYSLEKKYIPNLDLYSYYKNKKEIFVIIIGGEGIDLYNIEDILENIRNSREDIGITFGCLKNEEFKPEEINLYIYSKE